VIVLVEASTTKDSDAGTDKVQLPKAAQELREDAEQARKLFETRSWAGEA
jgi:hypothetical protein